MITNNNNIKCDFCGRFIKGEDIMDGKAYNRLITPSSDISHEKFESGCRVCVKKYNLQKHCITLDINKKA